MAAKSGFAVFLSLSIKTRKKRKTGCMSFVPTLLTGAGKKRELLLESSSSLVKAGAVFVLGVAAAMTTQYTGTAVSDLALNKTVTTA